MEVTLNEASKMTGCSVAALVQAVRSERLPVHRRVGRSYLVESLTLMGYRRSLGRGRMWDARVRETALALIAGADRSCSSLSSSEEGRLRRSMATMSACDIAYRLGGVRGWHRYRAAVPSGREKTKDIVGKTGPSVLVDQVWADRLGLFPGETPVLFGLTPSLADIDESSLLIADDEGDLMLREDSETLGEGQQMTDLYMFGQQRESMAAAHWLEERCRTL